VAEGLRCLYERGAHLPWFVSRKKEPANSPLILEQAFSEALDLDKRERVGCYEVHLDRKLERMLVMLLRLKDLRQGANRRTWALMGRSHAGAPGAGCRKSHASGKGAALRHRQGDFLGSNYYEPDAS
jgi:hypothetical protein